MKLTLLPSPILAQPCERIPSQELRDGVHDKLISEMKKTMKENNGIGLAANQVGKEIALCVIDESLAAEHDVPSVFANPEITEYGKERDSLEEGCLSIPDYWTAIERSKKIMFKALDASGKKIKFRARGMLARVLQHETDHLNGVTIRDKK